MKFTHILGSLAVGIGAAASVIAVKTYYYRSALTDILVQEKISASNYFLIDRIIDGDCMGQPLYVGIHKKPHENPMSGQGIRRGEIGDIKRLISFSKSDTGLLYEFEGDVRLSLSHGGMYSYTSPMLSVIDKKTTVASYKSIGPTATELDAIQELR